MLKHFIVSGLLILFYMQSIYSQSNIFKFNDFKFEINRSYYDTKIHEFKLKEKSKFPDNFPLQIGAEYGYGFRENEYGIKDKFTFWQIFLDANLTNKVLFLTLEYGQAQNVNISYDMMGYLSLGLKIKYLNENQHKIYLHAALGYSGYIPFLILSTKYLYSFNKYFGASLGCRYIRFGDYDLGFLAGIQIFTN